MRRDGWLRRRNGMLGRVCKWAGVAACLVTSMAWIASIFVVAAVAIRGVLIFTPSGAVALMGNVSVADRSPAGLSWHNERQSSETTWLPSWEKHPQSTQAKPLFVVVVPFWTVLCVLALPTAFLFLRDRRYPPGHCQECGYDLTGNVSGVCPECGAKAIDGTER